MSAREWLDGTGTSYWQPELNDKRTLWKIQDIGKSWGYDESFSQIATPAAYKSKRRAERIATRKQKSIDKAMIRKLRLVQ